MMRMTLSIPEATARRFRSTVPPRSRSRIVAGLIEQELTKREGALAAACLAANKDRALDHAIDEWQSFDERLEE